jgi:MSHA biogenesis protein MshK
MKHNFFCIMSGLALLWTYQAHAQTSVMERDPTQPSIAEVVTVEPQKEEKFVLQGIIVSPTRRLALMNDHYVKEGDKLGNATVKEINKNTVILSRSGEKITVYLFEQLDAE